MNDFITELQKEHERLRTELDEVKLHYGKVFTENETLRDEVLACNMKLIHKNELLERENARLRNGLIRARAAGIRGTGFDAGEAIILARWVDNGCVDDLPEAPPWVKEWIGSVPMKPNA